MAEIYRKPLVVAFEYMQKNIADLRLDEGIAIINLLQSASGAIDPIDGQERYLDKVTIC